MPLFPAELLRRSHLVNVLDSMLLQLCLLCKLVFQLPVVHFKPLHLLPVLPVAWSSRSFNVLGDRCAGELTLQVSARQH